MDIRALVFLVVSVSAATNDPPKWTNTLSQRLEIEGIAEDKPPGFSICCIKAEDPNGDPILYSLAQNDVFKIEKATGVLTLLKPLDRERDSIIPMEIRATDGQNLILLKLMVSVFDVNDWKPIITGNFFAEVYENATKGQIVYTGLNITDNDVGDNAQLDITCDPVDSLSKEACEMFSVTSQQRIAGNLIYYEISIRLLGELDYEADRGYIMTIRAKDNGRPSLNSTANILFEVLNVQDEPPIWIDNPMNAKVDDNSGVGTFVNLVGARDRDGNPRDLSLAIVSDPDEMFQLEPFPLPNTEYTWARIVLRKPVDRETQTSYRLDLRATEILADGTLTDVFTEAIGRVQVRDVNDEKPTFSDEDMTITIQEGLAEKSEIPIMNIRDNDTNANGKFVLSLQQPYDTFEINPPDGVNVANLRLVIKNSEKLDYETPAYRTQIVKIIAKEVDLADTASTAATVTGTVTVIVEDVNDNYPTLTQDEYELKVSEDMPAGSSVLKVTATDLDEGSNGKITYSLEGAQSILTGKDRFVIDANTGEITLNQPLNYEDEQLISMFIVANDGGGLQDSAKFVVEIVDVNDEAPTFALDQYTTSVEEGTSQLFQEITVVATDAEANAVIKYAIVAGDPSPSAFSIHPDDGILQLNRVVKFEETFGDTGAFLLNISASDSGNPPKFGYTLIRVNVIDKNDNPPEFSQFDYRTSVSELAAAGTSIFQVNATDKDAGINGDIIYRITNGSMDHFSIDNTRGIIRVSAGRGMDYDLFKKYVVTVMAEDKGSPPMSGTTHVTIDIIDANNKLPYFPDPLILSKIPTNAKANHEIVTLKAIDLDTNALLEYSMKMETFVAVSPDGTQVGSGIQNQLTVNSSTGEIYLIQSLNMNGASEFRFQVEVQDNNAEDPPIQRATAQVIVTVYKESGKLPEFNSPWTVSNPVIVLSMQEEEPKGTVVTTLIANDPLTGEQLDGFLEVPGSDPKDYFRVEPDTGRILLNNPVDYDTIFPSQVSVVVKVSSKDGQRSNTAKVILNIQDINDNNPQFLLSEYVFEISENKRFPSQVGIVQARDDDRGGKYGQIVYSITGRGSDKFNIDPQSGFTQVAEGVSLDRETEAQYDLLVIATNEVEGEEHNKKATSVRLTIRIRDENDVTPHFDQSEYTIYAVQTAEAQSSLGRVRAEDEDEASNGDFFYSIDSGNEFSLFYINAATGEIRSSTKLLNYARVRPYTLMVHATDNGVPTRIGKVPVHIYIQDLQAYDGRPKFQRPFPGEVISILEEQPADLFVVQVVAVDNNGPDEAIRFSFLTGNEHADHQKFNIDPVSGNITTTQKLDREVQESYNLIVLARDGNIPVEENTIVVLVKLLDLNDSIPTFYFCNTEVSDPMYATVMENQPDDMYVTRIISCDNDTGENERRYHHISCGNEAGFFKIGTNDGVITTTQPIDREKTPKFNLCVRVSNQHNVSDVVDIFDPRFEKRDIYDPTNTGLIHVKITIGDEDDNGPSYAYFAGQTITIGIPVVAPFGSSILDARVMDPDGQINSRVDYEVTNLVFRYKTTVRKAPNMFTLGQFTGSIRTGSASYSDYAHGYFEMNIKAKDKLNRPSSLTVFIYILSQYQRLKFVFSKRPESVRSVFPGFNRKLEQLTDIDLTVDNIRFSLGDDAKFNYETTDVCFHAVYQSGLMNYQDAGKILNAEENSELRTLYSDHGVESVGLCTFGMKSYTHWTVASFWWVIIIVALALILFCIICIIVIYRLWNRYKNYMATQTFIAAPKAVQYESRMTVSEGPSTLYVILGEEQNVQTVETIQTVQTVQPVIMRSTASVRLGPVSSSTRKSHRESSMYAEVKDPASPTSPTSHISFSTFQSTPSQKRKAAQ